MNDFEHQLKALRLTVPSPKLDQRLSDAFAAASSRPEPSPVRWWWFAALAATGAVAAAAAFLVSYRPAPPAPPLYYHFEAQGPLRQLLLEPPVSRVAPPRFVFHSSRS